MLKIWCSHKYDLEAELKHKIELLKCLSNVCIWPQQAMVLHAEINGPYIILYVGANKAFSFFESLTCHTEHTGATTKEGLMASNFPH